MPTTRRKFVWIAGSTVALAGCLGIGEGGSGSDADSGSGSGSGSDSGSGSGSGSDTGSGSNSGADSGPAVTVRSHEEHGEILVGNDDMALYMYDRDSQGEGESACGADCADGWPPLTVDGEPSKGDDVAAELTTFEREDGATQVAAAGWPLYYFASDEEPAHTRGHGASDVWWLLRPDGSKVE